MIYLGHKDISYIAGQQLKADASSRLTGHKRALTEQSIRFYENLLYIGDFKETSGSEGLKHFIDKKVSFSAIVCANDEMTSGSMKYVENTDLGYLKICLLWVTIMSILLIIFTLNSQQSIIRHMECEE